LGAMVHAENAGKCLDVGAGCGVISLMLAQRFPMLEIDAVELDPASSEECAGNFTNAPWNNRLKTIFGDFLTYVPNQQYNLIVSNPPFYTNGILSKDHRKSSAKHNASMPFSHFFEKVKALLSSDGQCWVILSSSDVNAVEKLAQNEGLHPSIRYWIFGRPGKKNRCILAFRKELVQPIEREFVVRNENGSYTDAYKELTKDFHFNDL
jgi:tRNA1Val (adenine37-N6)-methyltransferase